MKQQHLSIKQHSPRKSKTCNHFLWVFCLRLTRTLRRELRTRLCPRVDRLCLRVCLLMCLALCFGVFLFLPPCTNIGGALPSESYLLDSRSPAFNPCIPAKEPAGLLFPADATAGILCTITSAPPDIFPPSVFMAPACTAVRAATLSPAAVIADPFMSYIGSAAGAPAAPKTICPLILYFADTF